MNRYQNLIRNKLSPDGKIFWDSLDEQTKEMFSRDVKEGAMLEQVVQHIEDAK